MNHLKTIEDLADIIVNHSLRVKKGESVVIHGSPDVKDLVLAVHKKVTQADAYPWQRIQFSETEKIFYEAAKAHQLDTILAADKGVLKNSDCFIFIRSETNSENLKNVSPHFLTRRRKALWQLQSIMLKKRWCTCLYPSETLARKANLTLDEYTDVCFKAINQDWSRIEKIGRRLAHRLSKTQTIAIKGPDTQLSFSIKDRDPIVGAGRYNLPDGEVFTSPVEDSINGHIVFDVPIDFEGHAIAGTRIEIKKGVIVNAFAEHGYETLETLLNTDAGARRIGEFGIGINYGINKPTNHIAMDEKIGGTCHLAIGFSLPNTGGKNKSAIHLDFIKDIRHSGRILADGEVLMQKGIIY